MTNTTRKRRTAIWIALGLLVLAGSLVALLATSPAVTSTEADTPLVGKHAPTIDGVDLSGSNFRLSDLMGRWVLINFFASWCPPCHQEQPELVTFAFEHRGPGGVALVGVAFDDSASSARQFLTSSGSDWPAIADPNGQIAIDYGVRGPPETFLVSPAGIVVAHFDGPVTAAGLDRWLKRAQSQ